MKNYSSKLLPLDEAIARYVKDGNHITLGGATGNRNPLAAVYEIIRQKKRNLSLYGHIMGTGPDLLIGSGCVGYVEFGYFGVGRFAPTAVCFRRAVTEGRLRFEDYTNLHMVLRFLAGALGIPFIPTYSDRRSDITRYWGLGLKEREKDKSVSVRKFAEINNPFDRREPQGKVLLLPAINPDVTIVHVQKGDVLGNARIEGLTFADLEQIKSAHSVILTCEEIIETEELVRNSDLNQISSILVDCVVHVPFGAHPTQCYNYYDYDTTFLYRLREVSKNDDTFQKFLDEYVFGVEGFPAYLEKVGSHVLDSLRADPEYGYSKLIKRKNN